MSDQSPSSHQPDPTKGPHRGSSVDHPSHRPDTVDQVYQSYFEDELPLRKEEGASSSHEKKRLRMRLEPLTEAEARQGARRTKVPSSSRFDSTRNSSVVSEDRWNGLSSLINVSAACGLLALIQLGIWWLPQKQGADPLGLAQVLPPSLEFFAPDYLRPNSGQTVQRVTALKPVAESAGDDKLSRSYAESTASPKSDDVTREDTEDPLPFDADRELEDDEIESAPSLPDSELTEDAPNSQWQSAFRARLQLERDLDGLMNQLRGLDELERNERAAAAKQVFDGLCEIGNELTVPAVGGRYKEIIEAERGVLAAAKSVLAGLATAPDKLVFVSKSSDARLTETSESSRGLLFFGRVRSIRESRGTASAIPLTSVTDKNRTVVAHVAAHQLSQTVLTGDLLLVLGRRIPLGSGKKTEKVQLAAAIVYPVSSVEFDR